MKIWIQIIGAGKVIGAVGIIGGAALWMNAKFDASIAPAGAVLDSLAVINQNIEYLSIENSQQDEKLQDIVDTLANLEEEHKAQGDNIRTLTWAIQNKENFTPDQLRDIMDEMLKKNNMWIPYATE